MLTELRIQNFAIIDRLDLKLGPGLTILTGETGAGKSIILDAVVMLIGGRADTAVIRAASDAAFVEGTFSLKGSAKEAVNEILKREDLDDDPNHVTLTREVRREGRSVARLNGRTVTINPGQVGDASGLGAGGTKLHLGPLTKQALNHVADLVVANRGFLPGQSRRDRIPQEKDPNLGLLLLQGKRQPQPVVGPFAAIGGIVEDQKDVHGQLQGRGKKDSYLVFN